MLSESVSIKLFVCLSVKRSRRNRRKRSTRKRNRSKRRKRKKRGRKRSNRRRNRSKRKRTGRKRGGKNQKHVSISLFFLLFFLSLSRKGTDILKGAD